MRARRRPSRSVPFGPDRDRRRVPTTSRTRREELSLVGTPRTHATRPPGRKLFLAGRLGHESYVWSAQFSPDGTRIVTASADKTARVWDAATGKSLATLAGHEDGVWSAQFSPDGTRIVTASGDKTARVWDAATGKTPRHARGA